MATTTNFGWETPDDTDLVKDGAAAIRTALGGVDTSFVDLKGGTTGQVLAKATATDLDFSWVTNAGDIEGVTAGVGISGGGTTGTVTVTNSMATAIDAKGDLVPGTGADAFARLAVGANATVLTADSAEATGMKWAAPSSGGMTLLSTTTLSGSSTVVSSINQTYNDLQIVITNPVLTASNGLQINPNSTAGVSYNQGVTSNIATGSTQLKAEVSDTSSNPSQCIVIRIVNYTDTVNAKGVEFFGLTTPDTSKAFNRAGCITLTAAITSLQFVTVAGTFTSGTVKIYGVK